jgi:hypothetical protein
MPPVAASLAEYATPATAPGRDVVVTDSGGAVTVSAALADAGVLSESVTSTVQRRRRRRDPARRDNGQQARRRRPAGQTHAAGQFPYRMAGSPGLMHCPAPFARCRPGPASPWPRNGCR